MYAITLETSRQKTLTKGKLIGFDLENSAYSTVQPNQIYTGDQNELVLKLTNCQTGPLQLFGGELPASAKSKPDLKSSPSTLFLDFGDVFKGTELSRMSVDKITIGGELKLFKDAGWKFKSFADENRLGLCPGSDMVILAGQTVAFHFTGVSCTNQEFTRHTLYIYYTNMGGRFVPNLGTASITPLLVSLPPKTNIAIGNNLTVDLSSADNSDPAKAWITSQPYLDANPNSWLPNELILKLAFTPQSRGGSLDLTGAEFLFSFVAGDDSVEGALTTPDQVNQISCEKDANWSANPDNANPRQWKFTTVQPLKANSTAKFKFTNIHIGPKFVEGDAYAYLLFRSLPGFYDGWFVLRVVRSQAKPKLKFLNGPTTEVPFGTAAKLSWTSFAVPYLGLSYSTVYPTGKSSPINKHVPGEATNEDLGKIGDETKYILSGYNSKADFDSHSPLPGLLKEWIVTVIHSAPSINSFTARCSPTMAILQWGVTFGEMEDWLNVEIQDENGVPLYRPEAKDRKGGSHTLKPSGGLFDEKTTFKLVVWNSKLPDEKPTKEIKSGNGLELLQIKSFTATPASPFVLGPAKTTLRWDAPFEDLSDVRIEKDGALISQSNGWNGLTISDIATRDTVFMIHARRKDGLEASSRAEVKAESVEQFLFRQTVKRWDVVGDDRAICELPDWPGYNYYIWFIETISFNAANRQAEYIVEFGTNRANVHIGCKSEQGLKERDGRYYLSFKEQLRYYSSWRINDPSKAPWDGNVFRFGQNQEMGTYRLDSSIVGAFEFQVTPTGLIGGPDWTRGQLSFGWPHTAGWWKCVPKHERKTTTLDFNL